MAPNERLDLDRAPSLRGKRILITGGSRGIGRTLALAFRGEGAHVSTCARDAGELDSLRDAGVLTEPADVTDPEAVDRVIGRVSREWGELDAVVNNAAVLYEGRLADQPLPEWRRTIEVNLQAPLIVIRAALRIMKRGCIVNVTSGLGRFPMIPYGAYCVSKAGLNMLTRALALELGPAFRVNAIDPGEVRTRMNSGAPQGPESVLPVARALVALNRNGPSGRCYRKDGTELLI